MVVIYFDSGRTDSALPESLLELMNETNDWNEGEKRVWRFVSRFQRIETLRLHVVIVDGRWLTNFGVWIGSIQGLT